MSTRRSATRHLVEEALADRDTNLVDFVRRGRTEGKNVRQLADDIRFVTGVPLHWRTLYRWIEKEAS